MPRRCPRRSCRSPRTSDLWPEAFFGHVHPHKPITSRSLSVRWAAAPQTSGEIWVYELSRTGFARLSPCSMCKAQSFRSHGTHATRHLSGCPKGLSSAHATMYKPSVLQMVLFLANSHLPSQTHLRAADSGAKPVMDLAEVCTSETFPLSLPDASILSLETTPVANYTVSVPASFLYTQPPISAANVSFCNVTVSYTHPGHNDTIIVETWLPTEWNERLQAVGGSGSAAGRCSGSYMRMDGAVAGGYVTVTTDAGLGGEVDDASSWALDSEGNVNMHSLKSLASVSLYEEVSEPSSRAVGAGETNGPGDNRQIPHRKLLRPASQFLILERLLTRWSTGPCARAAVPGGVRRHRGGGAGHILDGAAAFCTMASAGYEHGGSPLCMRGRCDCGGCALRV